MDNVKKRLGIPLCAYFGISLLGLLYFNLQGFILGTNSITANLVVSFIQNLACGLLILYASLFKDNFNNAVGRIAGFGLVLLYALFTLNTITGFFGVVLLDGQTINLIVSFILFAAMSVFLFFSKAWLPVRILGSLKYLFSIVSTALLMAWFNEIVRAQGFPDYSYRNPLVLGMMICGAIEAFICLITMVLTIIWMSVPSLGKNTQSQWQATNP